jgi:hypothetical protein
MMSIATQVTGNDALGISDMGAPQIASKREKDEMDCHPAANLFPLMDDQELDALAADIEAHGLHNPVTLLDGKVLDGRNRLLACERVGVEPHFRQWEPKGSPVLWLISQNVQRRSLTASQKALIAVEAEDLMRALAAEAKQRQRMGSETILYPEQKGKTTDKAAKIFGVNEKYLRDVKRIKKEAPALVEQMRSGAVSVPDALRRVEWIKNGVQLDGRKWNIATACRTFFTIVPREIAQKAYEEAVQQLGADSEKAKALEFCWEQILMGGSYVLHAPARPCQQKETAA